MFCGNGSGMATLLQQKNCMKTLSNGGVGGGGNSTLNNTVTATLQPGRVLLPHEMVNLPSSAVVSTAASVAGSTVSTTPAVSSYVVSQQQQQQQQQHNQIIQQSNPQNIVNDHANSNSHNNEFSNQFSNRYFTQNNFQETNIAYVPATVASVTKSTPSTSSHILITNSTNNIVTSASSFVGSQQPGPLTVQSLAQHNQILQFGNGSRAGDSQQHHSTILTSSSSSASNLPSINRTTSAAASAAAAASLLQHGNLSSHQSHPINSCLGNSTDRSGGSSSDATNSNPNNVVKIENSNIANGIETDDPTAASGAAAAAAAIEQESDPEVDIVINNVVCSFSVRCHLNLRDIALNGFNVEFRRENGMVTMKLRRPYTTASIWSSGRITCTGATSEEQAKIAARRYARCLQKLGFRVRFHNFRVVNVLGTCSMPWAIKIVNFSEKYKKEASYEPELHPGVTYKLKYPKATLKIFSTGSITVTAGSVAFVQAAIEHIFPLVYEFRKKRTQEDMELLLAKQRHAAAAAAAAAEEVPEIDETHSPCPKRRKPFGMAENDPTEDIMYVSDIEEDVEADEDL